WTAVGLSCDAIELRLRTADEVDDRLDDPIDIGLAQGRAAGHCQTGGEQEFGHLPAVHGCGGETGCRCIGFHRDLVSMLCAASHAPKSPALKPARCSSTRIADSQALSR